jgi:hypothetical protein
MMERNKDFDDAARALESRDKLEGSFELSGEMYPLRLREPTLGELEEIDEELAEGAEEVEAIRRITDEYLIDPSVDVDDIGIGKLRSLFVGMRDCWGDMEHFEQAEEEMPLQGNERQPSRR